VNKTEKMVSAKGDSRVQKNKKKQRPLAQLSHPLSPRIRKTKTGSLFVWLWDVI
jgi:hypothetical protein